MVDFKSYDCSEPNKELNVKVTWEGKVMNKRKENLAFSTDIYLQLHVLPFVLDVYSLIMNELNKWKLEHGI